MIDSLTRFERFLFADPDEASSTESDRGADMSAKYPN